MASEMRDLREILRHKLMDEFQSASMADMVLALVMPEISKLVRAERESLAALAEQLGSLELADAIRAGKMSPTRAESDRWTRPLPFREA
jgi:hypothetical protein